MNLKSLIKQYVAEAIVESQYGAEDDMHYDGNDLGERDPNYQPKKTQSEYKKAIVIKKEPYGISVTPYNADGKICGGGLLHYSYQDDQYSDAIKTANHLKGKYPNFKYIDLIGSHPSQLIDPDGGESSQWNSFKQSEKDGGEHSHAPEMRVRSDEPQNDITEVQWDNPEEKSYSDVNEWVSDNIKNGLYNGEPLHNYGFTYKVGQPVNMGKGYLLLTMRVWNDAKKKRNDNLKLGRPVGYDTHNPYATLREGFDPQSMGVNTPMQAGESDGQFYSAQNDKMRKMEEAEGSYPRKGTLSPKGLATVEKWATTMDSRDAAKRIIDSVLRNKLGLTSDDLADTTTFANGLDMIEELLKTRDYQGAYDVAKDTANEMIEEEGGGEMDENLSTKDLERFSKQEKNPYVRKAMGMPEEDEDYVEYVSQRQGEEPFTLRTGNGQEKFEYVNGKYKSGKVDISVYAFRGDVCYGYNHFRKMFNLSESDINSVRPRDNGANIPKEPEDAPNKYTKMNSDMSNMGNLEETLPPNFPAKLYKKLKAEYPDNDKAVYATAHKLSKKYGNKLEEIVDKAKCVCKNCGTEFEPTYGEYNRCPDCMSSQHDAGERATGTQ